MKKSRATLRLRRVVVWPHDASTASSRLRLTGSPAAARADWMYSKVSKVGFAPRRAYLGPGGCGMRATATGHRPPPYRGIVISDAAA